MYGQGNFIKIFSLILSTLSILSHFLLQENSLKLRQLFFPGILAVRCSQLVAWKGPTPKARQGVLQQPGPSRVGHEGVLTTQIGNPTNSKRRKNVSQPNNKRTGEKDLGVSCTRLASQAAFLSKWENVWGKPGKVISWFLSLCDSKLDPHLSKRRLELGGATGIGRALLQDLEGRESPAASSS